MKNSRRKITEDLTGRAFGRWRVKSYAGFDRRHLWNVVCECGNNGIVGAYQLKHGKSKSCGCLAAEINRKRATTHGETAYGRSTPEFRAYTLAKAQCTNHAHENYSIFGGRGVEFRFGNFDDFLQAVGRRPGDGYVLTRKNQAGNYEAGNVEWTRNRNRLGK